MHGDFLVGPAVTPALANMPAILPRDLALALFPLTVWFALRAIAGRRMRDVAAAGALAGCLLLIGPVGAVVAVLVCGPVALRRRIPVRHAAAAVAVAAVVVAPWLGRVALNYVRLGGFSPHQPLPSVTASQALVAMGVVLPIGLIGVVWMLRTRPPDIDLGALVPLVAVPAVLCLLAGLLPGHSLAGVAPVVKLQRYLPFFVLALAMPAGWAADAVLARMSRRGAIVLATALVAAAGASTVLTSIGLAGDFRSAEPRGLHCRGGAPMGAGDVVAVAGMPPTADPGGGQLGVPQHRCLAVPLGATRAASLPRRVLDHQGAGRARRRDARDRARSRAGGHRLGDTAGGGARALAGQGHQLPGRRPPPLGRRPGLPATIIRLDR